MTRIITFCASCRLRLTTLIAVGFVAHWVVEVVTIVALALFACQ